MCNFTCAISKRNRVSTQNSRIQGRSCQRPADRPQSPRGRSHTFTQKGPLFHSFSLGTGSTMGRMGDRLHNGAVFRCVVGSCSAGPVLRAQGSSGEDGVFALCARGVVDRFQCLLRPGPAAAGAIPAGSVPHIYTKGATLSLILIGDRLLMGAVFRYVVGSCSAGSVLRAQGSSGGGWAFALCARGGVDRFQCLLRPGPAAAGARWVNRVTGSKWVNKGQAPNGGGFSVRCWVVLRGTVPARAGKLGGRMGFRAVREGGDHFQCLRRPGPAAAVCLLGVAVGGE